MTTDLRVSYFVCGTPRAGTSLLTGLLKSTGIAGKPEEYFWRDNMSESSKHRRGSTFAKYVAGVMREGTTANGVFGSKLMWGYMNDFLSRLRGASEQNELSDRALLELFFGSPRFVWISRKDVIAQAVSWAKAIQTDVWYDHLGHKPVRDPKFDFDQIDALVREATEHNEAWQRWFATNGFEPHPVRYEDLVLDYVGTTGRILHFLGIEFAEGFSVAAETRRQGDALNERWVDRYCELVVARREPS